MLGLSLLAAVLHVALTPSVTSEGEMALKTREDRRLLHLKRGRLGGEGETKEKLKIKEIISIMFLFHMHYR